MIRIAALADPHFGPDSAGSLAPLLADVHERADVLLIAGDLTRHGDPAEAAVAAAELRDVAIPTVAVLGNHDYHSDREAEVVKVLDDSGIRVLEGDAVVVPIDGYRLGIAGTKGFGGGFVGASASDFGEPEMRSFVQRTKQLAHSLEAALGGLDADARVALLHYSPVGETLDGERPEIFPFLGSYLLAEAVDRAGADLVLHGHAHLGREKGATPGGVPVRNVALSVIGHAYRVYTLEASDLAGAPVRGRAGLD